MMIFQADRNPPYPINNALRSTRARRHQAKARKKYEEKTFHTKAFSLL
jgi:hypothetical protein